MPGRFLEIPVFLWDYFIMPHSVGTVMLRLSVMVPVMEFQTRGATHAKLPRANVVRDRGRLRRLRLLDL